MDLKDYLPRKLLKLRMIFFQAIRIKVLCDNLNLVLLIFSECLQSTYACFKSSQGGYDLLGRTKDQIRTTEQVNAALEACKALKLDSLVIIGGLSLSSYSVLPLPLPLPFSSSSVLPL